MRWLSSLVPVLCVAAGLAACESPPEKKEAPATKPAATASAAKSETKPVVFDAEELKIFQPLPTKFDSDKNPITEEKVTLGRVLYYETRLSKNHDLSCNSCHDLAGYGVDNKPTSPGHKGQLGARNSPTVYNAGIHFVQFWDGRAATLEDQAKGPILNPVEMAMPDEKKVVELLKSIDEYVKMFKAAFPTDKDPITYDNMANAIGAFERKLVTPGRFDKFLAGDAKALTDEEKAGLKKFITVGCTSCHVGPALGGTLYQKLGLMKPWADLKDNGRADATKDDRDKGFFKVPTLRNVEKTAPYLHDGSIKSLDEMVEKMAWHQSGVQLKAEDTKVIVTFLKALTGDLPADYIKKPELPKSGPKTPKADPS
jgi:cytochrome c peroxidase